MAGSKKPDLDGAYALKGKGEAKAFYAAWADDYDTAFAEDHDYILHRQVAEVFRRHGGAGPVLDLGAGTGLVGTALSSDGISPVDGTDISDEMLAQARSKGVYRDLFAGDLTGRLPVENAVYAGLVSAGTFTTGHVGPGALDEVLRVAAPGALLALSVKPEHFHSAGFAGKLVALADRIASPVFEDVPIYGPAATGPHARDRSRIVVFRKL